MDSRCYIVFVTTGDSSGVDSLLPIVTSQRERFKQRNLELEAVCVQSVHERLKQLICRKLSKTL